MQEPIKKKFKIFDDDSNTIYTFSNVSHFKFILTKQNREEFMELLFNIGSIPYSFIVVEIDNKTDYFTKEQLYYIRILLQCCKSVLHINGIKDEQCIALVKRNQRLAIIQRIKLLILSCNKVKQSILNKLPRRLLIYLLEFL